MNDLIKQEQELLPFDYSTLNLNIQDVEFLKSKELSIKVRTSQTIFENGRDLLEAKEKVGHGNFLKWVEGCFPWSQDTANRYMNVAKSFQNTHGAEFQKIQAKALYLLSAPSTPEVVRQEAVELAESGETVTHAKAKELVAAHKEIERLKAENEYLKSTPDEPITFPLIPEIENLLKTGRIMPAKAKMIQDMTPSNQRIWLSEFMGKFSAENQADEAKKKAQKALEKAMKAIEEKESAIAKLSEVTENPQTAEIIAKHELQLKHMKERYEMDLRESEKRIAKEASEFQAKMHREKIEKAEKEKALAEKREKEMKDKASAAWRKNDELIRENKKLQSQIEVDKPSNIDNARALKLESELKHLDWTFPDIKAEAELAGGEMHETKKIIIEIINRWSSLLQELDGQEIIEINQ